MSLYYVQKFLYELNRDAKLQDAYMAERDEALRQPAASPEQGATPSSPSSALPVLQPYELSADEVAALIEPDIGMLYVLGVNGQILMHFAALHQIEWADYLQRMRDGVVLHGPVRAGVYAITGYEGTDAHAAALGHSVGGRNTGSED